MWVFDASAWTTTTLLCSFDCRPMKVITSCCCHSTCMSKHQRCVKHTKKATTAVTCLKQTKQRHMWGSQARAETFRIEGHFWRKKSFFQIEGVLRSEQGLYIASLNTFTCSEENVANLCVFLLNHISLPKIDQNWVFNKRTFLRVQDTLGAETFRNVRIQCHIPLYTAESKLCFVDDDTGVHPWEGKNIQSKNDTKSLLQTRAAFRLPYLQYSSP